MRNVKLKSLILLLGLLSASGASAGVFSYVIGQSTGESNARYEADQQAIKEGRISCVPQPNSDNLWKCEDAYHNKFENLLITSKDKNGTVNLKRAGN